jgi:cysteine-rich repeat protein
MKALLPLSWLLVACGQSLPPTPFSQSQNQSVCGDGVQEHGEACDDGNLVDTDGCLANCTLNVCRDGFVWVGMEACDDGNVNDRDGCTNTCSWAVCGDGVVRLDLPPSAPEFEACDDGNDDQTDDCRSCALPMCGDGVIDPNEECDDGNTNEGDGCATDCSEEVCGNGRIEGNEACDDSNTDTGDGCHSDCTVEACGNGRTEGSETCDDGNTDGGDGCASDCVIECGNGQIDANEECDDGNVIDTDACTSTCHVARCGDGWIRTGLPEINDAFENCDDGNTVDGDACTNDCRLAVCGDGVHRLDLNEGDEDYEDCDDGNADDLDACRDTCRAARCGDGVVRTDRSAGEPGFEACEDGNDNQTDACRNCLPPRCGDGVVDIMEPLSEECDSDDLEACDPETCQARILDVHISEHNICINKANDTTWCWGDSRFGQTGNGPGQGRMVQVLTQGNRPFRTVTMARSTHCGLTTAADDTPGTPMCWAGNASGMLGRNHSAEGFSDPIAGPLYEEVGNEPAPTIPVAAVDGFADTMCLIDDHGAVYCWGASSQSRLGTDRDLMRWAKPYLMTTQFPVDPDHEAVDLSAGNLHHCFVQGDGTTYCWGNPSLGRLGTAPNSDSDTPQPVIGLDNVIIVDVEAGHEHTCARSSEGAVYCWGNNNFQQLGQPNLDAETSRQPLRVNGIDQVSALAVGYRTSCALRLGVAYCWGDVSFSGTPVTRAATPVRIEGIPEDQQITKLALGYHSGAVFLTDQQQLYAIGDNQLYRLFRASEPAGTCYQPNAIEMTPWDE